MGQLWHGPLVVFVCFPWGVSPLFPAGWALTPLQVLSRVNGARAAPVPPQQAGRAGVCGELFLTLGLAVAPVPALVGTAHACNPKGSGAALGLLCHCCPWDKIDEMGAGI